MVKPLSLYIQEAVNTPKEGSYGFVYLTINKVNNRAYVGMCSSKKSNAYIGSGTLLKIAIKKYGKENFSRTILESCATEQELREAEKRWIEKFDAVNSEQFYNLSEGGRGGKTANYRKMSSIVKATWDAMTPEERKARMQKTNSSNKQAGRYVGQNNPMYGRSAVKEKNLRWYNNGIESIYVTEGTQPTGYVPGRGKGLMKRKKNNADI